MTFYKHTNGDVIDADETNEDNAESLKLSGLNTIRSLIDRDGVWSKGQLDFWGDAYIDADGREGSVTTVSALFDTNKYKTINSEPIIIIEATSLTPADFAINDCVAIEIDTGKWLLKCTAGTDEVKRAQLYKTLFFGTDGTNARASSTYLTSITALKTSISRDVGKRAYFRYVFGETTTTGGSVASVTDTFNDTTNNYYCSSWSNISNANSESTNFNSSWQLPSGTTLHSKSGDGSSNEIGTNTVADEYNNPANCKSITSGNGDYGDGHIRTIILCVGALTVGSAVTANGGVITTNTVIDFYTTNSIPLLTEIDENDNLNLITHTIPAGTFSATISSAIGIPLIADWESGADIQYKLTGTGGAEDTGWLDCSNSPEISSFTSFTAEPDTLVVKLIPKNSSPSAGYPAIKGFVVRCD